MSNLQFKTKQTFLVQTGYSYELEFDADTMAQVKYFIDKANFQECQWFHNIERIIDNKKHTVTYRIFNMLIPEQIVTAATVESDEQLMVKLAMELREKHGLKRGEEATEEAIEAFNQEQRTLNVWAHSHVKMACNPSGTDKEMWGNWVNWNWSDEHQDPIAMFIFNQLNEYYVQIADPMFGITITGIPLKVEERADNFPYVADALKNKIKRRQSQGYSGNSRTGGKGTSTQKTNSTSISNSKGTSGVTRTVKNSDAFEIVWARKHARRILEFAGALVRIDTEIKKIKAANKDAVIGEKLLDKRKSVAYSLANVIGEEYVTLQNELRFLGGLLDCYHWMTLQQIHESYIGKEGPLKVSDVYQWINEQDCSDWEHPEIFLAAIEIVAAWPMKDNLHGLEETLGDQWDDLCSKHIHFDNETSQVAGDAPKPRLQD